MRRFGMLLLVLVLATASLLAAAAYNTASVVNAATVRVVTTDQALLAMTVGGPEGDGTAYIAADGTLMLDFNKGLVGEFTPGQRGLQPDSTYIWQTLFWVRGRSNNVFKYRIDLFQADGVTAVPTTDYMISIYTDYGAGWQVTHVNQNTNTGAFRAEGSPYFNKPISVKIEVPKGATVGTIGNLKIIVTAIRQ